VLLNDRYITEREREREGERVLRYLNHTIRVFRHINRAIRVVLRALDAKATSKLLPN